MITEYTHFVGLIELPDTASSGVITPWLQEKIDRLEPKILTEVLGYQLYSDEKVKDLTNTSIIFNGGVDYTDKHDRPNHYSGFKQVGLNPIANYIYCIHLGERYSTVTLNGVRSANVENMKEVYPSDKIQLAWNQMVEWLWIMDDYIRSENRTNGTYASYLGLDYPPYDKSYSIGIVNDMPEMSNNQYFQKYPAIK